MTDQTQRTLLFCSISAVISGLLIAGDCAGHVNTSDILRNCHLMAINNPMRLDFHWINWLPGILFGLFFALANPFRRFGAVTFTLVSGAIYYIAGLSFALFDSQLSHGQETLRLISLLALGAMLAGMFGAVSLSLVGGYLSKVSVSLPVEIRIAEVGMVVGALFFFCGLLGQIIFPLLWTLAFLIWQLSVGFLLSSMLQKRSIP